MNMEKDCIDCYKIKCKGCGWEPNDEELIKVRKGIIKVCPDCGWSPSA